MASLRGSNSCNTTVACGTNKQTEPKTPTVLHGGIDPYFCILFLESVYEDGRESNRSNTSILHDKSAHQDFKLAQAWP